MYRSIMTVNPLADLRQVSELLDRVFDSAPTRQEATAPEPYLLPVDIFEHDNKVFIRAAVPGIDPKDLDVTIDDGVLTIKGETRSDDIREDSRIHRREYRYGVFSRSIRLPENLDSSAVEAEFKNGLVTVSMPRIAPVKPQLVKVPVKGLPNVIEAQEAEANGQTKKASKS